LALPAFLLDRGEPTADFRNRLIDLIEQAMSSFKDCR
jgi:hypothetical protein